MKLDAASCHPRLTVRYVRGLVDKLSLDTQLSVSRRNEELRRSFLRNLVTDARLKKEVLITSNLQMFVGAMDKYLLNKSVEFNNGKCLGKDGEEISVDSCKNKANEEAQAVWKQSVKSSVREVGVNRGVTVLLVRNFIEDLKPDEKLELLRTRVDERRDKLCTLLRSLRKTRINELYYVASMEKYLME